MRVFVAGATGVLGRRLVGELTERGHDVVGLTRDERGDGVVESAGGEAHRGDLFDRDSLEAGAAEADVVVQAATAIPMGEDPEKTWELNDRVRREGAENLTDAVAAVGADRHLQESVVWVARQPDGSAFDEDSPTHPTPTTASAVDAEDIVREFGRRLQRRRLPVVGRGGLGRRDARLSFLHVDDAATAYAAAVEGEVTGTFHVGRLLANPMPTSNARVRGAFDWAPS